MKVMRNYIFFVCNYVVFIIVLPILFSYGFYNSASVSAINQVTTGEWQPAQTYMSILRQNQKISTHNIVTTYVDETGDHYTFTTTDSENYILSFMYKIESNETAKGFDTPTLIVFANNNPLVQLKPNLISDVDSSINSDWQLVQVQIDPNFLVPGYYELSFQVKNLYDEQFIPVVQVKEVRTDRLFLVPGDKLVFQTSKPINTLHVESSSITEGLEFPLDITIPTDNTYQQFEYKLTDNFIGTQLSFWSLDTFNNLEEKQYFDVVFNSKLIQEDIQYQIYRETDSELNVQLSFSEYDVLSLPRNFDLRISRDKIITDSDWEGAQKISQKKHSLYYENEALQLINDQNSVFNLLFEKLPNGLSYLSAKQCSLKDMCTFIFENYVVEYPL